MRVRKLCFILLILISSGFGWRSGAAQGEQIRYFAETGHYVGGAFLQKFNEAKDPLVVYGYPLTDAYVNADSGRTIQYFQRALFELHPEEPADVRVKLVQLGVLTYTPGPPLVLAGNPQPCRYYPLTQRRVCGIFLGFYLKYGGEAQFGYPISEFETHEGRFVQYFQMARFEWYPENPVGSQVVLTDLGMRYFEQEENPSRLLPNLDQGSNIARTVLDLRVRAFAQTAITRRNGTQVIMILVRDQNQSALENARLDVEVELPSGEKISSSDEISSDNKGLARFSFAFNSRMTGPARVTVTAHYGDLEKTTVTSFRLWW